MRSVRLPTFVAFAFALAWLAPVAASAASLTVDVRGLADAMQDNVKATLDVKALKKGGLTEAEIRQFHTNAERDIQQALQPFGYYRPIVNGRLDHEGARWHARYDVDPGPPMRIDTLEVRVLGAGTDDTGYQRLVEAIGLHRGAVLNHALYENTKRAFEVLALKSGYLDGRWVDHTIRVDLVRYTAGVSLVYDTGPAYQFGPAVFRQDAMSEGLLQGYVTWQPGDSLDMNKLLGMEQALGNSPYWSRVEVRPDRSAANGTRLPIIVDLTPAKRGKYTFGAGFGTDDGAHVRSMIELRRLNRRGHRALLQGSLSNIERSTELQYIIPWPYPRTDILTLGTGYAEQNVASIDEKAYHVGADLSRMWAGWQYAFGLQFRRQDFVVGLDRGIVHFTVPSGNWSRLLADDPVDPKKGWRLVWHVEGAHQSLLSSTSYARLDGHARWLHPMGGNTRLLARADLGWLGTGDFHRLPPSARFFAGGANSVRGYGYNELGPKDAAGHTIGGEVLEIASLEYDLRFGGPWGIGVFYDIGNAMRTFGGPLEQAAGPGLRWVSPVGLVRLDYGFPLTTSTHRATFHISIGPAL